MKKLIFFISLLILSSGNLLSQSGWFWQNPLPQGNNLHSVQFVNANTFYAAGSAGCFMKTTNNGLNWVDKYYIAGLDEPYAGGPKPISTLFFINSETGFIGTSTSYNNNNILRTTNGGVTWDSVTSSVYPALYVINFINQNSGWAFGGSSLGATVVLKTTNSGLNWYAVNNTMPPIHSCYFVNSQTGWFIGDKSIGGPVSNHLYYIYKTTNGGTSFESQVYLNGYIYLNSVYFLNENTGWVGGSKLFVTTNSGQNWTVRDTSAYSISFFNNNIGFFVGSNGIFKTTNSGLTWFIQTTMTGNSISVADLNNVITVGNFGSITRTINSGINWNNISSNVSVSGLYSVKFVDNNTGYIIENSGDYSLGFKSRLLKTTNKGSSWGVVSVLAADYMMDQCFYNETTGWVVGRKKILKTSNGGYSWDTLYRSSTHDFYAIDFYNENFGCAVSGNNPSAFYTSNGGLSWVERSLPYYSSNCKVYMIDNNLILLVSGGGILRTTNSGLNWQPILGTYNGFQCSFRNLNNNFYAKDYRSIYKSTDLGSTWNLISDSTPTNLYSLYMANELTGYGSGLGGNIVKTTNGGYNWYKQNSKTSLYIRSIFFTDENSGWAVGENGTIISTIDGGGNLVVHLPISNNIPQTYSLNQNYPNPFNPVTKIKFDIPEQSNAKIIIYDLLGREITTLVNELLKPGSYSVDWDGTGYASGVYFYSLVTDDPSTGSRRGYVETKRMLLIK